MQNLKKRYLAVALGTTILAGCNGGSSSSNSAPCNPCTIYVTESSFHANLIGAAESTNYIATTGVLAADYLCNIDNAKPDGRYYKSLIADGVNRFACTSPNCGLNGINENHNWVLHPGTTYQNINESLVWITNESAIFPFGTLTNPITTNTDYSWSGESKDWVAPAINDTSCTQWSSSTAYGSPIYGQDNAIDSNILSSSVVNPAPGCNNVVMPIICVAQ